MPVLVDHAKTRDQIADLACGIVAREGLHALSMRRVAAEAGTSRAIVSTYFRDMRDLVLATFQWIASQQAQQFEQAESRGLGVAGCVESLLPLDQERLDGWRVTIAFLGYAVADAELASIERQRIDSAVLRFERLLVREGAFPRASAASRREAQRIVSCLLGVAVDYSFDPSAQAQPRMRAEMVQRVLGPHTTA